MILQTNKTLEQNYEKPINDEPVYDLPAKENGSISEPAVSIVNRQRVEIPDIQTEPPCKCPLPFYPAANCALCFHIPSYTENNFVRLIQYSKQAAMEICVDELKGEIPSSELSSTSHKSNQFLAKEHLTILQKEISVEAAPWFGATWDSNKEEYLSDKGNSEIV